jgi:hypothetical protein
MRRFGHVRSAPAALDKKSLVGEHLLKLRLIGGISDGARAQFALSGARLRGQDMAAKGMIPDDFTGTGPLEPLRRTLVCL